MIFIGKLNTTFTERWLSRGIYPFVSGVLTGFANLYRGSLGEIIIVAHLLFIVFCVISFGNFARRKQRERIYNGLSILFFILCWNFFLFQIGFGINNYRQPMEILFELDSTVITEAELADTYTYLVEKTNVAKREALSSTEPLTLDSILSNTYLGYRNLAKKYPFITPDEVLVKPLRISHFFSTSGYTGIYLYFVGEPNINSLAPLFSLGFVASHEIGHQKGFASENDANFVGFLACIEHPDPNFVYSGYEAMLVYVGNSLYETNKDLYTELSKKISDDVVVDLQLEQAFWKQNIVKKNEAVHNAINDSFLKANNQPEGLASYSRVTELVVKAYNKRIF